MKKYDISFIGHFCLDEIVPFEGKSFNAPGSAVLCGAMAAARIGCKVQAIVKLAKRDSAIVKTMQDAGIDVYPVYSSQTTLMKVIHPSANVDEREMIQAASAGKFTPAEIPEINSHFVHLAGISDQEFDLELIRNLKNRGYELSCDMQSFVRQVDPVTKNISFSDVKQKKEITAEVKRLKLDIVEAEILTGTKDIEKAGVIISAWGAEEILITEALGVLAHAGGKSYYQKFSNKSFAGRTGRGDTTFAGYLARRMTHGIEDSLKFAAAMVSIKMETQGPFAGTLQDVLKRMGEAGLVS